MKRVVLSFGLLLLATAVYAQSTIPGGTILPIVLTTSIDSSKAAAGDVVTGVIAQDVPLGSETIHRGTKVVGKVISAGPAKNGGGATLSFRFDEVQLPDRAVPITADLRAVASFVEVFDAKLPDPSQEGRLPAAWTYDQIGGNEAVYAGGGDVRDGIQKTGTPFGDGVLAEVRHDPGAKCRGPIEANNKPARGRYDVRARDSSRNSLTHHVEDHAEYRHGQTGNGDQRQDRGECAAFLEVVYPRRFEGAWQCVARRPAKHNLGFGD